MLSLLYLVVKAQQYFVTWSCMFLLEIWLSPGLNLTIFRTTGLRLAGKFCARKENRSNEWSVAHKHKNWARFNFYVYARPFIHYFTYARKTYATVEIHPYLNNSQHNRRFISQARGTRRFARSASGARIAWLGEEKTHFAQNPACALLGS